MVNDTVDNPFYSEISPMEFRVTCVQDYSLQLYIAHCVSICNNFKLQLILFIVSIALFSTEISIKILMKNTKNLPMALSFLAEQGIELKPIRFKSSVLLPNCALENCCMAKGCITP